MPLALPTPLINWNKSLLNRCAYSSLNQAMGDAAYTIGHELVDMRGFTCKGSSNGVAAALDGVNRWTTGNDAKVRAANSASACSWLCVTLAGGRGDVVFAYRSTVDYGYEIWWSPGGLVALAGTATWEPTATDKISINGFYTSNVPSLIGSTAAGDRLVSIWSRPDKTGFRVAIAAGGSFQSLFGTDAFSADTVGAGITAKNLTGFYIHGDWNANLNAPHLLLLNAGSTNTFTTNAQKRFCGYRSNGGGAELDFAHKMKIVGVANAIGAISPVTDTSITAELQGGASYPMKEYGLYSVTAGARGDVGWLDDWYISRPAVADGDTTGALAWICVEATASMWWPWDGATAVVMS